MDDATTKVLDALKGRLLASHTKLLDELNSSSEAAGTPTDISLRVRARTLEQVMIWVDEASSGTSPA